MKNQQKSVKFYDMIQVITEPEHLKKALQEARTSDHAQRQVDRARRERLLSPILRKDHREKIYRKLYSEGFL